MSARVCYIERTDRGGRITGLRLVGPNTDERWEALHGDLRDDAKDGASWLADRLASSGSPRRLDRMCLDADGAVCGWLGADSADPKLVKAMIDRDAAGLSDDPFAEVDTVAVPRFPDLPNEVSLQPLAAAERSGGGSVFGKKKAQPADGDPHGPSRFAVLATPDVPARLLIDELDRAGIEVGSVVSVWHAASRVWDASSGHGLRSDRVVADSAGCVGVVLVDIAGRLSWSWSAGGELVAAGAQRLPLHRTAIEPSGDTGGARRIGGGEEISPEVRPASAGRLGADWLGWSAQLGYAPARVVCVVPKSRLAVSNGTVTLDAGGVAAALRKALPSASIDLIDIDDPVGETLVRLAKRVESAQDARTDDGVRTSMQDLSNRPGRAHRAMYRWVALALLVASAFIGVLAWNLRGTGTAAAEAASAVRSSKREILRQINPEYEMNPFPVRVLGEEIRRLRGSVVPTGVPPEPLPILEEVDTITLLLGNEGFELEKITVTSLTISAAVIVDGTQEFEFLRESLRRIAGSNVVWNEPNRTAAGERLRVSLSGLWTDEVARRAETGMSIQ